ncbi:MAG: histidine--tRNA ligase [Myxococcota bacterium]
MRDSSLQPPRGARDFYPDEFRRRAWLFARFRSVARAFAFEEIDAPVLEHADLFIRKAGEEIVDQLYHFELHDRHLALRPEMTPQLARMVLSRAGGMAFPIRWSSVTQNWRYERMTRGRLREHYQWNMDIWGEADVTAEAELIAAIFTLLGSVGLPMDAVRVRVNSRALLETALRKGVLAKRPEAFEPLCVIIDKLAKLGADAVVGQLCDSAGPVGLCEVDAREVVALLETRSLADAGERGAAGTPAFAELERLFDLLDAYGVADRVVFDASVVRGLAYYTGIVFEAFDTRGELRSVCGGGRYDRLAETLGGRSIPAVGFGFGDVVIAELMKDHGIEIAVPRDLDAVVYAREEPQRRAAIALVQRLRAEGQSVELVLGSVSQKRALKDADRGGAKRIWVIGPEDAARGVCWVRDLASGEQSEQPLPG